jgi:hypothetical protein
MGVSLVHIASKDRMKRVRLILRVSNKCRLIVFTCYSVIVALPLKLVLFEVQASLVRVGRPEIAHLSAFFMSVLAVGPAVSRSSTLLGDWRTVAGGVRAFMAEY